MKKVLSIAGSDCSGGAGIQADLKTFSAHGVFGMSVIVSVVAENTSRVIDIQDITPDMIAKQIDAVFEDICCWEYPHLPLQKQYRHNRMVQIIWELAQCSLLELKPTLILYQWKNYRKSAQPFLCR